MRATPITPMRAYILRFCLAENRSPFPVAAPNQSSKTSPRLNPHTTQSSGRTLIGAGGERSIKKSNSETPNHRTGILISHSSSCTPKVKRDSSYHVNENESPMPNAQASSPPIRRAANKRKFEFDIDSDSSENGREVAKKRHIIDHRRPPITIYHSYLIGNLFQREKMLEGFGGFDMESRLGEGSEKRCITHNKAVKKRGARGVAERGMRGKGVV